MSFLERVRACHGFDPAQFVPFRVDGMTVGRVRRSFVPELAAYPDVLAVGEDAVDLGPSFSTYEARSQAMAGVLSGLREAGHFPGWRDEPYAVCERFGHPPLLEMERAAVPLFGIEGFGVHMNGIVETEGGLHMWVGQRSRDKQTAPGKLDQMVAGGLPAGLSVRENLIKECQEEAGVPRALAAQARPTSAISYEVDRAADPGIAGLRRDTLFVFDLDVPPDFVPENTDGELECFHLWSVDQVMARVRETDDFKFNCALVVIDFLIRRGLIGPDDPDYLELIRGLRR